MMQNRSSSKSNTGQTKRSAKMFRAHKIQDTYSLTPDNPEFYKLGVNLVILTKYGRGIYIRHGNEDRCSSFFATLGTIVNKLELSFGKSNQEGEQPAKLKFIKQGDLKLYVLRRLNYMYICWSKSTLNEVSIYAMIELVHHQLMSCLTGKVNSILQTNQTYDPSINFGKTRSQQMLLHYAFENGLTSLPVMFNAIPVMPLPSQTKSAIASLLREQKVEGLQINILMTMSQIIGIHKQKGIDLTSYDIFLFQTLIQSQSSLFKSEIWYPICLPGVSFQERVFCYINFLTDQIIHIMVSDQAQIFPQLSEASRRLKDKILQKSLLQRINLSIYKQLITDPTLERSTLVKHFVCRYSSNDENVLDQMVMSSGSYFGQNDEQWLQYLPLYGQLLHSHCRHKSSKKQKIHVQSMNNKYVCGYYEQGSVVVYFIGSYLCELQDCKVICNTLLKYMKQQEGTLWINKFV